MIKPSTILELAGRRIEDAEFFTQNTQARNTYLSAVDSDSAEATCWCAEGAVTRECTNLGESATRPLEFLTRAANQVYGSGYVYVNDTLGHDATVKMFGVAVNLARGNGE